MKQRDIQIGERYMARVSGNWTTVRITSERPPTTRNGRTRHGGWDAVNERTGRTVRILTAARLSLTTSETVQERNERPSEIPPTNEEEALTESQAAVYLGVSSPDTVQNWLKGGHFPGAFKDHEGHWRFLKSAVEAVKSRMQELARRNHEGDVLPPNEDHGSLEAPLL